MSEANLPDELVVLQELLLQLFRLTCCAHAGTALQPFQAYQEARRYLVQRGLLARTYCRCSAAQEGGG